MSDFFVGLMGAQVCSSPVVIVVLGIVALVLFLLKKKLKPFLIGVLIFFAVNIVLSTVFCGLGILTDPETWCEHEYQQVENVVATCSQEGKIVNECKLCGREEIEVSDKKGHKWKLDSSVPPTCTEDGYSIEKCENCSATNRIKGENANGHTMIQKSQTKPTYDSEGKVTNECSECGFEETVTIPKLEHIVVEFHGMELTFGTYTFAEVDNMFSEYDKKPVVKIPVTVKNVSNSSNSLNMFQYTLFGSKGAESGNISFYFNDDVCNGGELLPGKSYTKYFHIVYDGDGVYTIQFNDFISTESVEISVVKG